MSFANFGRASGTVQWQSSSLSDRVQAVSAVAEQLARLRMLGAPNTFAAWQRVRLGGSSYTPQESAVVGDFLRPSVGTRAKPVTADHLQGLVAEHLWYLLELGRVPVGELRYLSEPKFHATAPGGDGIAVTATRHGSGCGRSRKRRVIPSARPWPMPMPS